MGNELQCLLDSVEHVLKNLNRYDTNGMDAEPAAFVKHTDWTELDCNYRLVKEKMAASMKANLDD